ncbi:hypothetical protein [Virgibacillus sp. MG-45]
MNQRFDISEGVEKVLIEQEFNFGKRVILMMIMLGKATKGFMLQMT